ncbi:ligase-associated DNA damage response endonuclease PdeM [Xanthobacter aminoxidans]|uniref:Ligase-associated DNA damage response endonuclease PdeM n=1 Tax=Xanthobacter aminoxidans TaxID=186280 RepID=A0ABW6ZMW8_9HYPH
MLALAESADLSLARIDLRGAELELDPSGALLWPDERLMVVADLHLEKGSAFARRGQMLPPYDTLDTLKRLSAVVALHQPRMVIALGDSLHDRWAGERMTDPLRDEIRRIQTGRTFIWIAGNHDPLPHDLGGEGTAMLALGPLLFRHEPQEGPAPGEVCGHLHPAARVVTRGRGVRRRCFVTDGSRMILPAFGAYAGGLSVADPAIARLFPARRFTAHLLGAGRTYGMPASACI